MPFSNDWCLFFENSIFSICPFVEISSNAMPFSTDWCPFLKILFSQFALFLKFHPMWCPFLMMDALFSKFSFSICPLFEIPSHAMPFSTDWCPFLKILFSQIVLFLKFYPMRCRFLMIDAFFQNSHFRFVPLLKFTPMRCPFLLIDALSLQLSFLNLPFSSNSLPCDALFYWLMPFP